MPRGGPFCRHRPPEQPHRPWLARVRPSSITGDYFGEMGLIDGEPRAASIAAVDEL
jgi:hypothetical protein